MGRGPGGRKSIEGPRAIIGHDGFLPTRSVLGRGVTGRRGEGEGIGRRINEGIGAGEIGLVNEDKTADRARIKISQPIIGRGDRRIRDLKVIPTGGRDIGGGLGQKTPDRVAGGIGINGRLEIVASVISGWKIDRHGLHHPILG